MNELTIDLEEYKQKGFHTPGLEFLSNFYHASFYVDLKYYFGELAKTHVLHSFEITSATVEHVFQACKTTDIVEFLDIVNSSSAGLAKIKGQKVSRRKDWFSINIDLMRHLRYTQFSQYSRLRKLLVSTGDLELIEYNNWGDEFWGVDINSGKGENHLGKILMGLREEYRNKEEIKN